MSKVKESTESRELKNQRAGLEGLCEMNIRYHQSRYNFLDVIQRLAQGLALMLIIAHPLFGIGNYFLAGAVALISFILVFNIPGKAAIHQSLFRQFMLIAKELIVGGDKKTLYRIDQEMYDLYSAEPSTMRALVVHCHNQACLSHDSDSGYYVPMGWYRKTFRNVFSFNASELPNQNQIDERNKKKEEAKKC